MTRPELRTERLLLTPMGIEHLPLLVDLDSDPEVMRHILGRARTAAEAKAFWVPKCVETDADGRGLGWWVGYVGAAFVGWWVLSPGGIDRAASDELAAAETGWRLSRRWWGRGLATEGASAVLDWGFENGDLEMVWAAVDPENGASRGVMRHLGMTEVDAAPDTWSGAGELRYEVPRAQWRRRQQRPR